jgi:peptidoglycan-associated lipoprotein
MKRLFIAALIILGIITIVGCAQRQVTQAPEQGQAQATAKTGAQKEIVSEKPADSAQQSEAKQAERELETKVEDVHFDFDKSDVRDDAKPTLKKLSGMLSANTKLQVVIEGNCDERGTSEYNLALGDRRANAAKSYLVSLGIPSGRSKTISYGKEKPLCTESSEECWSKNRRDHFVLTEAK